MGATAAGYWHVRDGKEFNAANSHDTCCCRLIWPLERIREKCLLWMNKVLYEILNIDYELGFVPSPH